ncbi:MAG: histidine kinase dimerization/phospho-acceptor domain-containing protein [Pseudomonadota bacterium]
MFFDDRLATVLRQRTDSDLAQRTQYRQLLDILGNRKYGQDQSLIAAAWLRMSALAQDIPSSDRAAMVREAGWRFRSADLAAHLAECEPEVASAALFRAGLTEEDWTTLIPRLPVRARGFLRRREDLPVDVEALLDQLGVYDRGLPSPTQVGQSNRPAITRSPASNAGVSETHGNQADEHPFDPVAPPEHAVDDETEAERSEISALVERIAQFRRTREEIAEDPERSPRLPLGEAPQSRDRRALSFGFVADAAGRIEWAEPEVAAMVIGMRLVSQPEMGAIGDETALDRAFARRQPLSRLTKVLTGASAVEGEWIVDAQPRFTDDGSFSGYVGRFRRLPQVEDDTPTPEQQEADRIRQLLHELRTPVTAIQGYAEVVQQQLFGPAPHEYRALAAIIAADAAHILAGFEELDRIAKLETGALDLEKGETDLGALVKRTTDQLSQVLSPRMAGIELSEARSEEFMVALGHEDAETLLWRYLATLAGGCATGEVLKAQIKRRGRNIALICDLPAQLAKEPDIFAAEAKPIGSAISAGLFGAGFALRLARAEAISVSGHLKRDNGTVTLCLPMRNGDETLHNHA